MLDRIYNLISSILLNIRYGKSIYHSNAYVKKCAFEVQSGGNHINLGHFKIVRSLFIVRGNNNKISIGDTTQEIFGLSIKVYGNDNVVEIKNKAVIFGLRIVVRGEDCRVVIGEHFTENINCMITCMGRDNYIIIGDDCMLSENIDIWNTDSHQITDIDGKTINNSKPIIIGNHVWIGKNCTVLKGVSIGDNSIIGMSSVVTKNIDANSIYVGNPARKVKDGVSWNRNYVTQ